MPHVLGEEPKLTVAAIDSRGQLIRAAIKTVPTTRDANEQIELQAKLLNYYLGSNKSNINQSHLWRGVQCTISDHICAVGGALTRSLGRMLATGVRTETRLTTFSTGTTKQIHIELVTGSCCM